jgi:hypothetical protein
MRIFTAATSSDHLTPVRWPGGTAWAMGLSILVLLGWAPAAHGAVTSVTVQDIEVTQATQCLDPSQGYTNCPDNSVDIVFGKLTGVRVYLSHNGGGACSTADPTQPVALKADPVAGPRVVLRWLLLKVGDPPTGLPDSDFEIFDIPCTTNLDELRQSKKGSANFVIPGDRLGAPFFVQPRVLWVEVEVSGPGFSTTTTSEFTVGVLPALPSLDVKWLLIDYKPDPTSGSIPPYTGPALANSFVVGTAFPLMKKMYPMPVRYSLAGAPVVYGAGNPDIRVDFGSKLIHNHMGTAYSLISPSPDSLMGWLPKGASALFGNSLRGLSAGSWSWCVEQPTLLGTEICLAHEVGHTQGRNHLVDVDSCAPDSDILEEGLDVVTTYYTGVDSVKVGSTRDFMATTGGSWISPYVWNRLLGKAATTEWSLCTEPTAASAGQSDAVGMGAPPPVALLLGGRAHDDGSGELDPVYQLAHAGPFAVSDPAGSYCLDFETLLGALLGSHCFDLSFTQAENGLPLSTVDFSFLVPKPAGTEQVVLRLGASALAAQAASMNFPDLFIPPVPDDPATFSWVASDLDGDDLEFIVLYSPDAGASWFPMAIGLAAQSLTVPAAWLAGGDSAQIRVLASDGLNTTSTDSAFFAVPRKPPFASIVTPEDGAQVGVNVPIVLWGVGQDLEDGEIDDDAALEWSVNGQTLGSGSEVILDPGTFPPGVYEITLTVTDSDGQEGTATVTLSVARSVAVDIKPGACPNPWNRNGRGVLTVAVPGTATFDVTQIDLESVVISRADRVGGSVAPNEGPPGPHSDVKDIATPFQATEACECAHLGEDGIDDLSLKFRTDELVQGLEGNAAQHAAGVAQCVRRLDRDESPRRSTRRRRLRAVPAHLPPGHRGSAHGVAGGQRPRLPRLAGGRGAPALDAVGHGQGERPHPDPRGGLRGTTTAPLWHGLRAGPAAAAAGLAVPQTQERGGLSEWRRTLQA